MVRLGLRVNKGTFIFDISDITAVLILSVGHGLAIGKNNLLRSRNSFAISRLLRIEFGTRVVW